MKILLITTSIPFPARNGRELPISKIFRDLSLRHVVDIAVTNANAKDYHERKEGIPQTIRKFFLIPSQRPSKLRVLLDEMVMKRMSFFNYTYDEETIRSVLNKESYDIVWCSPISGYALFDFCKEIDFKLSQHLALGLNDVKSDSYRDSIGKFGRGRSFDVKPVLRYLRSHILSRFERKFFLQSSLVHVQTESERRKAKRLIGNTNVGAKVIVAPNGIEEELRGVQYAGMKSNAILFMTHLKGDRKAESSWFLSKIWPYIRENTDAELWLVGTRPENDKFLSHDERIKVKGFVPSLKDLFESVRLAVVPIFHRSGLINRIQDSMIAGVPVVTTSYPASTFDALENDVHAVIEDDPAVFAQKVVDLYSDSSALVGFSERGRDFARRFNTWEESIRIIEENLISIAG